MSNTVAKQKLKIEDVMTPFPHAIGIDQPADLAKKMMLEHNIRHLPVQDTGRLVGIVSDRDLSFAQAVDSKEYEHAFVHDVFTNEPYMVEPNTPVATVARKMAQEHIGCTLVAEAGKLVGIFTTVDACNALAENLSGPIEK